MEKIYLQLTSGRGPRECAFVVARLLDIIQTETKAYGIACSVAETEPSKGPMPEAFLSATLELKGKKVQAFASRWLGTIQWIGTSPYRPSHKRRNWFIGITKIESPFLPAELQGRIVTHSMRSSGPGGQNVNKTHSAVRAIHLETGITVISRESRSQAQNQRRVREKIRDAFDRQQDDLMKAREARTWADHQMVERGNPVRIFQGPEFTERHV